MIEFDNTAVIITAAMAGALPGRPMVDVNGKPMIVHAIDQVASAKLGKVIVACSDAPVAEAMRHLGHDALVHDRNCKMEAAKAAQILELRDADRRFKNILIVPCFIPALQTLALRRCLAGLLNKDIELATLAGEVSIWREGQVKLEVPLQGARELAYIRGASLALENSAPGFRHLPIYAWRRASLETFAKTKVRDSEIADIINTGLRCAAVKVDRVPISVDTRQDLEVLRQELKA